MHTLYLPKACLVTRKNGADILLLFLNTFLPALQNPTKLPLNHVTNHEAKKKGTNMYCYMLCT